MSVHSNKMRGNDSAQAQLDDHQDSAFKTHQQPGFGSGNWNIGKIGVCDHWTHLAELPWNHRLETAFKRNHGGENLPGVHKADHV